MRFRERVTNRIHPEVYRPMGLAPMFSEGSDRLIVAVRRFRNGEKRQNQTQ